MKTTYVANAIIINDEGKILMTQRYDPENPKIHHLWQIPGGGIEDGESAKDACIREAKEETGLTVELLTTEPYVVNQQYNDMKFHLSAFLVKPVSGTISTEADEETSDAKWCTLGEIRHLKTLDNTTEMLEGTLSLWKKN